MKESLEKIEEVCHEITNYFNEKELSAHIVGDCLATLLCNFFINFDVIERDRLMAYSNIEKQLKGKIKEAQQEPIH